MSIKPLFPPDILPRPAHFAAVVDQDSGVLTREPIEPARLCRILYHLDTGFYDRPEILNRIADRVSQDL